MKKTLKVLVIGVIMVSATGCFVQEGANMANEVAKETLTGKNAIENYEWFKTMEQRIKTRYEDEKVAQKAIERFKKRVDIKKMSNAQVGELGRLEQNLDALRYSVNEMIGDYNARTSMTNRAMFKDQLPTNILRGVNQALDFKYGVKLEALPTGNN